MDFKQIQELIRLLGKTNISEFKYETEEYKINIRTDSYNSGKNTVMMQSPAPMLQHAPAPVAPAAPVAVTVAAPAVAPAANDESNFVVVKSPMAG